MPAMAQISSSRMTKRSADDAHRRHDVSEASDFQASQPVHAAAGSSSRSQSGWVNWKFMAA
jgi:hypothetical protein